MVTQLRQEKDKEDREGVISQITRAALPVGFELKHKSHIFNLAFAHLTYIFMYICVGVETTNA